ncbi:ABC transporter permease subunit [Haematospirillum jordaniae]|uniref:ABC transporter permease n=1 Tax=Haematospirillum jordaniae TaxID=1549855 RepID=UPI0009ED2098|nr:ABC transporter permease subunit [Haematospirillum jordaniae]NKD44918.1 ABC transporter permease subunit [Haematospirillum jordaniae]NKD57885.1 ABC transporter permease subunit [Haematospirillum jordaniae]NKD59846.1 ABC transporter permease subunit [Haematospirillum jordaniae]NKD67713.1 ABC transporter permease subunit [Haematospirillum jordaniae]NKD79877.1 ABC transporter permease subunit [Haematospirillum jordaniae]
MLYGFGPQLLEGLLVTVQVSVVSVCIGIVLGMAGGTAKVYGPAPLRGLAELYTIVLRGLPELLVVLLVYYGGSWLLGLIPGWPLELKPFAAGCLALATTFGAYATEVFRGALQSIPKGQIEAGTAIGLGRFLVFRRIILPQVWRLALPGLGNLFLVLLKDSALVSVIGVHDLMYKADMARTATRDSFTMFSAAAVLYLLLTAVTTAVLHVLEKRTYHGIHRPA